MTQAHRAAGKAGSSNVAIATATCFVIVAAVISLALDRPAQVSPVVGSGWALRGAV